MINKEELTKLYELEEDIHETASRNGFWNAMDETLSKMESTLEDDNMFSEEDIIQVKKAFICQKIMLVVSELSECVESDRKSLYSDWEKFDRLLDESEADDINYPEPFQFAFETSIKDTFEDEIADAIIRILDLTKKMKIDIIKHIIYKMEYNSGREHLHGKEF